MSIIEDVPGENNLTNEDELSSQPKSSAVGINDEQRQQILQRKSQQSSQDFDSARRHQPSTSPPPQPQLSISEQAIIKGFIANIKEKEEYSGVNISRLNQLSIKQLMEESKNIVERINREQDENEMQIYSKIGNQNQLISEKFAGAKNIQLEKAKYRFITRYSDPGRLKWDIFIITLAFWNCFVIPVDIAYIYWETLYLTVIDQVINVIFLIDIIITFRTTYYNKRGEEVFDPRLIAQEYFKSGRFFFDFIACIPFDRMIQVQGDLLKAFGIFKLIRVSRLSQILQKVDLRDDKKALIQVFQLLLYLLMYVHCTTCLWWYIVTFDETWVPPKDIYVGGTDLYDIGISFQYFMCMYYSIMIVGSNELYPTTTLQKFYLAISMLVGNLIIANIVGEMAVLMQVITRRSSAFQEKLDIANTIMHNIHITPETQEEIRDFFFQTRITLEQQQELNTFLELISPSLRQQVSWHIFFDVLAKNPMLSQFVERGKSTINSGQLSDNAANAIAKFTLKKQISESMGNDFQKQQESKFGSPLGFIIQNLEIQLNRPEDVIIQQDDDSTDMYFLARGDAFVMMKDKQGKEFKLRNLAPGAQFGEIAMIFQTKRTATVISGNYSTFAKLTQEKYKELTQFIPELSSAIKKQINNYDDPIKRHIVKMIKRIEFLSEGIPQPLITQLLYTTPSKQYDKGQLIFKPGDNMNTIQLIDMGIVEIYTYFEGKKFILERLFKGSVINYRNLFLDDEPMQIYAECLNLCYILEIEEENLVQIVNQNQMVQKKLLTYQNELLKTNLVYALDYIVIIPHDIMERYYRPKNLTMDTFRRMTKMKNVVMRRVIEIRQQKAKPKLTDLLNQYLGKDSEVDTNLTEDQRLQKKVERRNQLKKKLLALYDDQNGKSLSEVEFIQKTMKNIKQKCDAQWQIIESLDSTMNVLKNIREEKDRKHLMLEEDILKHNNQ